MPEEEEEDEEHVVSANKESNRIFGKNKQRD
jgi:hypothetical protein